ncbi:MAG: ribE [Gammaproteobacteria bacterium]|jgi:riboflavin synthase|nr:ribE [Gammaproteobacteria bacterium]
MFSGIVTATGRVQRILRKPGSCDFVISLPEIFSDLSLGESVAVNGVCLTVTDFSKETMGVTAVAETLRLTNLGELVEKNKVNLERSITLNTRLGGHYVQGHVDGVGEILDIQRDGEAALLVKISMPPALEKYIVRKGYITLDGMSITVIETAPQWFTVTFIPHTQQVTIVNQYQKGSKINLEVDILGKYLEKWVLKKGE